MNYPIIENSALETSNPAQPSQASKIMELVSHHTLFHNQLGLTFIEIYEKGHTENWLLDDDRFYQRISYQYYLKYGGTVPNSAIKDAITTLKGQALHEGKCRNTSIRTAHLDDKYYIDLCDTDWVSIEICADSWTLIPKPPVAFCRSVVSHPLPRPKGHSDLEPLWGLINIPEQARILIVTYLLDCLRPNTHYPILVLEGEQGSAKSTTQRNLKMLIDPSGNLLRVPPKKIEDVFVGTANDHILSFNNVSHLSADLQDALCCFSTGGTYAARSLYTNSQESVINVLCPIMLNGIGGLVTRQDLMERCIYLDLLSIDTGARRTDTELDGQFEALRPELFGALLDLMVNALRILPDVPRDNLPRMADYCLLGRAVAIALGHEPSHFDKMYTQNQLAALERGLESCSIYPALLSLLDKQHLGFSGNFEKLLNRLNEFRNIEIVGWPKSSKALSTLLKRQAPALRKIGIDIQFDSRRRQDGYYLSIQRRDPGT
jgi:hypothetical protein